MNNNNSVTLTIDYVQLHHDEFMRLKGLDFGAEP